MRIVQIFFFFMLVSVAYGQNVLTIDDAVNTALKNNFDIRVARNNAEIAKTNNTPGNAGMLPTIGVTGAGSYENNNVRQKNSAGEEKKYPALSTTSFSAGTELAWTLFDGGKMFVTRNKLRQIEVLGEIQFKEQVLQTQYDVIAAYYDVVRQKQQLDSYNEAINFNRERVKIAQTGFDAGSLLKTDLLQAKIDLNVATENAINQQYVIEAGKKNLNRLLGRNPETTFEIADVIPLDDAPDKADLLRRLNSSNTAILSLQKQVEIAESTLKENKKSNLPVLDLNAGYYLSQTDNSDGTILNNRSIGPQVGGKVSIPLYTAGENKRKISEARLQLQSAEYNLENTKLQVSTDLENTLTEFENQQRLVQIESENSDLTKENFEISIQRLRLGQTNSLEVHQAQEDYIQSCSRFINFKYNLKMAETKLRQLISTL
ncbi:MAG: TolC family protein [Bacteroidales bacterium]|nr:TolC family protein [Bacteroidales bacterium]